MFHIDWWLTQTAWREAWEITTAHPPGAAYDRQHRARAGLLVGTVQFCHGDEVLLPSGALLMHSMRLWAAAARWGVSLWPVPTPDE